MEAFRAKQESVWAFIRHAIAHVREKDPVNALGVGNTYAYEIEPSQTAPLVDVLIFHNYFETRKRVRDECEIMKRLSQKYNKPVVNNECCCLCRSNPYDMELEILAEYGFGFYVFELMIGQSIWRTSQTGLSGFAGRKSSTLAISTPQSSPTTVSWKATSSVACSSTIYSTAVKA